MSSLFRALSIAVLFVLGCTPGEPPYVPIRGTVTLDGSPLAEGFVAFVPLDGRPPRTLAVKGGSFTGEARVGPNRVEVMALAEIPNPDKNVPKEDRTITINLVAERFNAKSTEVREVTLDGPNEFTLTVSAR